MKLRVLEVIRQGEVGGGESHVIDLVLGLMRTQDVQPVVLSFTIGPMVTRLRSEGVLCHVIKTQHAFDPRVTSAIIKLLQKEHIDIVHAHGSRAASNMLVPARRLGLPIVYTVHGWSFHQGQNCISNWLRRLSEALICRRATKVICVSQSNFETGRNAFGLSADKTTMIENGVNLNIFNPDASYPDVRKQLGFSADDFLVSLIGRITAQKGPLDFIKAIEQAHSKEPCIKALVVGEGDMTDVVDRYIDEHNCRGFIIRQPFRNDVPALLAASDVFCLPSLWEGLSIAMLEAMAMRKPMVVTPTDGARDFIHDGVNALVVPPSDVVKLSESFLLLAHNKELRDKIAASAHEIVRKRFDAARVADSVAEIYRNIAGIIS